MRHNLHGPRARIDLSAAAPSRRAVVTAGTWAVPAIALVVTSPALAVSGVTLSFSSGSYAGVPCEDITDAVVRAAVGGVGEAGVSVVLQLSDGYTFDAAAVTATVVTDADGTAPCGTIHVPGSGATGTLAASASGATSASATLTAFSGRLLTTPGTLSAVSLVPAGAVPLAHDLFLHDATLYRAGVGAVHTGVEAAGALAEAPSKNGSFLLPLRLRGGSAAVYDTQAGTVVPVIGIPLGATPVAADLFLVGSTVYRAGVAIATDVAAYGQLLEHEQGGGGTGQFELPYRALDGTPRLLRVPLDETRAAFEFDGPSGPPRGATPVAGDLFIADGVLYRVSWDGDCPYGAGAVATGIASWGTLTPNPSYVGERLMPVTTSSGAAALFMVSGNTARDATAVPAGATPIGADLFLLGESIHRDADGVVATGVAALGYPAPAASGSSQIVLPLASVAPSC
ncbi:hypothetical protein IFU08_14430 [Microbacterium sp. CFBP 8790]|uniref:hypothetical protein n=1 Tax=unclassified Microbacterium TaxID=2609290 RepID=UPI00177AE8FA|nr:MULTISPECIES: hypothetical protein [unclassified Microbacterium]MBD8207043.1 hypothetical protein [Microbacterium sp. CFBP 8801]MBD8510752.1 hypothetical protein [Microbacterium sp. CFBP 8790]